MDVDTTAADAGNKEWVEVSHRRDSNKNVEAHASVACSNGSGCGASTVSAGFRPPSGGLPGGKLGVVACSNGTGNCRLTCCLNHKI